MKYAVIYSITISIALLYTHLTFGQNSITTRSQNGDTEKAHAIERNVLTLCLSGTWISKGANVDNLNDKGHFVPGVGLDYFYRSDHRWEVGIMMDYEFATYVIPRKENLIRDRALILVPAVAYTLHPRWTAFAGGGIELEKHQNLFVFRLGMEYGQPIKNGWFVPLGVFFDWKEGYDALSFCFGIGKAF